ncbi:MAG TPA: hypothetical protein EYG89_00695 [Bacteroidia bacterium]|nr:hypothetical protein [Bacteroidia bacterium]
MKENILTVLLSNMFYISLAYSFYLSSQYIGTGISLAVGTVMNFILYISFFKKEKSIVLKRFFELF